MNKITFEEYKGAIKAQYDAMKSVEASGILLHPTPAQLRTLCLIILDNSLSKSDENSLKLFFDVKGEESLRKSIAYCDIARFRPIISFLKGEKDSDHLVRIELAAILVDFRPRPYNRYLLNAKISGESIPTSSVMEKEEPEDETPVAIWGEKRLAPKNIGRIKNKKVIVFAVLLSLFFMGYTVQNVVFPKKECMIWDGNHYEALNCKSEKLGIGNTATVLVLNEYLLSFKKITVDTNTVFFKNGKPVVWYGKSFDGNYEYFNQPGLHPETDKTLKPISEYIIKKYIRK
jgi:hypothetical protein